MLVLKILFLRYRFEIERTCSNVNLMRPTHLVRLDAVYFYASVILTVAIGFAVRRKSFAADHCADTSDCNCYCSLYVPIFRIMSILICWTKSAITYRGTHYRLSPLLAV
jgi:hypothetical protein